MKMLDFSEEEPSQERDLLRPQRARFYHNSQVVTVRGFVGDSHCSSKLEG